jgi:hypothetical protein
MEHDAHLADNVDAAGPRAKIITAIVIVAALLGLGAYMVYGSGMWTVHKQQTEQL